MLRRKHKQAIRRRKANKFIRRCWTIRSGLKYFPKGCNSYVLSRVVGVMDHDMIRIEMEMAGDMYQNEVNRYEECVRPLKSEVDCLLHEGWEKLYFY